MLLAIHILTDSLPAIGEYLDTTEPGLSLDTTFSTSETHPLATAHPSQMRALRDSMLQQVRTRLWTQGRETLPRGSRTT